MASAVRRIMLIASIAGHWACGRQIFLDELGFQDASVAQDAIVRNQCTDGPAPRPAG